MPNEVPPNSAGRRCLKFSWNGPQHLPPKGQMTYSPTGLTRRWQAGRFTGSGTKGLPREKVGERLPPLRRCAFCGVRSTAEAPVEFPDEHIVPEFLGAGLELREATCPKCQKVTSTFEGSIARQMFDPIRKAMDLRGKRGRMLKSKFPVDVGREVSDPRTLPIADHPTILTFPNLFPASSFSCRPPGTDGVYNVLMLNLNVDEAALAKHGIGMFSTQIIDTVRFCQVLAKIAHVYAVHVHGFDGFEHLVADFVRTDFPRGAEFASRFDHVGGMLRPEPASDNLHEIEPGHIEWGGEALLAVRVRLFACLDFPSYYVTVGRPSLRSVQPR
jgi:hypothetical protein